MYDFSYHRPSSLDEAVQQAKSGDDPLIMAGGMTLIPTLKQRLASPTDVIDIGMLGEMKGISVEGDKVVIKSMTTHDAIARSDEIAKSQPALAHMAQHIGDPAVRVRGTIGGSVANNDPAADYPAALVALGATIKTTTREIAADDFFTAMFETALEPGEIMTEIHLPIPEKSGYQKFRNPASRYAIVGVFVAKTKDGVRVAAIGAGPCVFRIPDMEKALSGNFSADAIKDVKVAADGLNGDIHASAEYRAHLVNVMARRAVDAAA